MKLKKKTKKALIFILIVIILVGGFFIYKEFFAKSPTKVKKVDSIPGYGYNLKSTHPEEYKKLFNDLKEILKEEDVNKEAYAKKISQMFIYDFFSLDYKVAKTDVGGVEFIYPEIEKNFLENAQSTYYKYLESNIYGNRNQDLPRVTKPKVSNIEQTPFKYTITKDKKDIEQTDPKAYKVEIEWNYTDEEFDDYQKEGTLILINDGKKLQIVELSSEEDQKEAND